MLEIFSYFFPKFQTQSSNTFYIGRKKIPMLFRKTRNGYDIKLGSGLMSYTLETNKTELEALSDFVNQFISNNP